MEHQLVTFLPVEPTQGTAILAAMRAVASADGALRAADEAALAGAAVHVLQLPRVDATVAAPTPDALAAVLPDAQVRRYACQLIAVMAFVDGTIDRAKIDVALAYAQGLGVDDDYLIDLSEAAQGHIDWVVADMSRKNAASIAGMNMNADFNAQFLPYDADPDAALNDRFRALGELPHATFGRAFYDQYQQNGYAFPGERNGLNVIFAVPHDSAHLISGYSTSFQGELLVSTFTAAMHREEGMAGHILPVIFFWHLGIQFNPYVPAHTGAFDGPRFWRAWERGRAIAVNTFDPSWDFWSVVDVPIDELRRRYRVPILEPEFAAEGDPPPVRPWSP